MTNLIDKSALVVEIEKEIKCIYAGREYVGIPSNEENIVMGLQKAEDIINTLEVKDVDLEKEINKYVCDNFFGSQTMGFFANRTKEEPNDQDIALCAKHFFELGLKAQNEGEIVDKINKIKAYLENQKAEYRLGKSAEAKYRMEAYTELLDFIKSLQEEPKVENPEYSFIETIYRCGKKPHWNIGDTLAYYEFTSDIEGEHVLGKITSVEFDEEYEDWFYTFENGYQEEEESLLINETYKKN